ncbi:unnamed protein product, partial [Laminaria digitata]
EDGREECIQAGGSGSSRGGKFRVCSGGLLVHRHAAEREPRVVGGNRQCHPTGAEADDKSVSDDFGGRGGSNSACPDSGAHRTG